MRDTRPGRCLLELETLRRRLHDLQDAGIVTAGTRFCGDASNQLTGQAVDQIGGRVRLLTAIRTLLQLDLLAGQPVYRQPSAGATWVRMLSMRWAL
jgi:hypothetical protein